MPHESYNARGISNASHVDFSLGTLPHVCVKSNGYISGSPYTTMHVLVSNNFLLNSRHDFQSKLNIPYRLDSDI